MKSTSNKRVIQPSYIRNILAAATEKNVISLAGGLPTESSFPMAAFREAAVEALASPASLQYGQSEGEPGLRQWVATKMGADIDNVLITSGAQQALDLCSRLLISQDTGIVVETPAYLGALQVFNLMSARVEAIAQTNCGPDLGRLEAIFKRAPTLFYAVPDFHNPTGFCWPLEIRHQVIDLAEKHQVTLFEDAPYRELRYRGSTLPSLYELAPHRVCHFGSFSKVAAPGLRLGFVCANTQLIEGLLPLKQATDLHSCTLSQRLLLHFLQSENYPGYLHGLTKTYARKKKLLSGALRHHLLDHITFDEPEGGMFLWIRAPGHNIDITAGEAIKAGLAIVPGSVFYPKGSTQRKDEMRLNFTHTDDKQLETAVCRLKTVLCD